MLSSYLRRPRHLAMMGFSMKTAAKAPSAMASDSISHFHSSTVLAKKETVEDLAKRIDLKGKRVLVRADLNVPLSKKEAALKITDDTRIRSSLPTIKLLVDEGAKVVLCSHLGRPGGKVVDALKMDPIGNHLSELLGKPVKKLNDCVGDEVTESVNAMNDGDVVLLENLRFHPQEEDNEGDFAAQLASVADVYVNDAFGAAHRAHASTAGVTEHIDHCVAGFLMDKELQYLEGALEDPKRPLAAIIGGGKVSSKLPILSTLLTKVDKLLIGGGMIFTFYRAKGYQTGKSLVDEKLVEEAAKLMEQAEAKGVKLILPTDVVVAESFTPEASHKVVPAENIPEGWTGMDVGPKSIEQFKKELSECHTIVWNGPMGVFEFEKFAQGTSEVATILADLTKEGVTTIIGGGDSVAAVEDAGVADSITHISTGGGASLELLEGRTLPGVAALHEKK